MSEPNEVPVEAQAQLLAALDTALSRPTQAQGFLNNLPDLSSLGDYKAKVVSTLDSVLGALHTINGYAWLIPDQYEAPLQKLTEALEKVKGWLD